jgi:hypothetical protein
MTAPRKTRRWRRPPADQYQLALPLAWLTEAELIDALQMRGIDGIRRVRYRPNRSRLISLSVDRVALNLHECFRGANDAVLDAIAIFLTATQGSEEQRRAVHIMRVWSEGQLPSELVYVPPPTSPSAGTREQMAFLRAAYRHLNRERFGNRLPEEVTIRLSGRMKRRFGHVEYRRGRGRGIAEIGLNIELLLEGNEYPLLDTLLHEMAHIEAWVVHGHRGHGEPWERIAARVGCEVNAASHMRIRRRRNGADIMHVPDLDQFLASARNGIRTRSLAASRRG